LIATLNDREASVRSVTAYSLGDLGGVEAVRPLTAALDDPDPLVRLSAATSLYKLGQARALDGILSALGDKNADIRYNAAYILSLLKAPASIPKLEEASKSEQDEVVKKAIDRALKNK